MKKEKKVVTISLSAEVHKELYDFHWDARMTVRELAETAILEYIERHKKDLSDGFHR